MCKNGVAEMDTLYLVLPRDLLEQSYTLLFKKIDIRVVEEKIYIFFQMF